MGTVLGSVPLIKLEQPILSLSLSLSFFFTLEIEFSGTEKALTWLQNQPSLADLTHQEPGGGILSVATSLLGR